MFRQIAWVVMLLGCASVAVGDVYNWIYQHNEYYNNPQNPGYPFYAIEQGARTIVVNGGVPNEDFVFEAVVEDNGQYVGPGDINKIEGYGSHIVFTVVGHNGHEYGAAHIKEIAIRTPNSTGLVKELNIAGDLGQLGPLFADAAGTITVGGSVVHVVGIYGAFDGSLTVGGDVKYDISVVGPITGAVTVKGDLCTDDARLSCAALGSLTVGGDVQYDIAVVGPITGAVTVKGDLCSRAWGAKLTCESLGSLTVGGDVVGDIEASATPDPVVRRYVCVA